MNYHIYFRNLQSTVLVVSIRNEPDFHGLVAKLGEEFVGDGFELSCQLACRFLIAESRDRDFGLFFCSDDSALLCHEFLRKFQRIAKPGDYRKNRFQIYLSWWYRNWGLAQTEPISDRVVPAFKLMMPPVHRNLLLCGHRLAL